MIVCIFYLSIHLFNQCLFTTYSVPNHEAKRRQFSALWCDICKEEIIIIIIRFLDFFVFQTLSTRKQRCSFIDCHISVFPEMSVLYFLLPGSSSFFCITRMPLNSWVACLQLGNSFLTLRESPSGHSTKSILFLPQHLHSTALPVQRLLISCPASHPLPSCTIPTGARQSSHTFISGHHHLLSQLL